ncbi:MAG TPA: glycoside hydrolase family 95 protein, partial [Niastella sp.]|nr:glycoside hydrolase family 95 protein [Niastella sp.]
MKLPITICCFIQLACAVVYAQKISTPDLTLWYNKPAEAWEEALPLGNGKTGAMVWGSMDEVIQLNDNTLWSGYPEAGNNPNGPTILPQVRQAVFEGDYEKAAALWKKMQGPYSARYLPMADLIWALPFTDVLPHRYYRELNLNTAIATVKHQIGERNYQREVFISYPAKVLVMRITADKTNAISGRLRLRSQLKFKIKNVAANYLVLQGKAPKLVANREYEPQQVVYDTLGKKGEGMNFEVHVKIKIDRGSIEEKDNELNVVGANSVTIYLSAATSFNGFNRSPGLEGKDPSLEAKANLEKAWARSYEELKREHIRDHQSLFKRVDLKLS